MSDPVIIAGHGCIIPQGESPAAIDLVLDGRCAAEPWPCDPHVAVGRVPEGCAPGDPGDDRAIRLALRAAELAMADSGAGRLVGAPGGIDPDRFACLFTVSKGCIEAMVAAATAKASTAAPPRPTPGCGSTPPPRPGEFPGLGVSPDPCWPPSAPARPAATFLPRQEG